MSTQPIGGTPAQAGVPPAVSIRGIYRRFWPYARRHRILIAAAVLGSVLSPVFATVLIGLSARLVDDVLIPRDLSAFWNFALLYGGITVLAELVAAAKGWVGALAGERFVLDLRRAVFARIQRRGPDFLERRALGDVITRLTGDVADIERLVVSGIFRGISSCLRIAFFTVALFWLRWELALAAFGIVPLFWMISRFFSQRIKAAGREHKRRSGALSAVIEESLANLPLVQAYNRQQHERSRFDVENSGRYRARMRATRLEETYTPVIALLELCGTLLVLAMGVVELAQQRITLGGLLAFGAFLTQLYSPIRRMGRLANTAYSAAASAERVIDILDAPEESTTVPGQWSLGGSRGHVRFDRVGLSYPGSAAPALVDVSLDVHPGEMVAIAGPSGSGKTTLIKLLLRQYDPMPGRILLDGQDLRCFTAESVRDQIAVLLQEPMCFDTTIGENVAFGRPGATPAQIWQALRIADLQDVVAALPQGLHTRIGQRGRLLSGGQLRRLALARAVLRDAPILVLDEPTAGLDPESATRVLTAVTRSRHGRTTLLVSHDEQCLRLADRVICIQDGLLNLHPEGVPA